MPKSCYPNTPLRNLNGGSQWLASNLATQHIWVVVGTNDASYKRRPRFGIPSGFLVTLCGEQWNRNLWRFWSLLHHSLEDMGKTKQVELQREEERTDRKPLSIVRDLKPSPTWGTTNHNWHHRTNTMNTRGSRGRCNHSSWPSLAHCRLQPWSWKEALEAEALVANHTIHLHRWE